MIIVTKPIARQQLTDMAPEFFGDMVKAVVDIDMKILAINAELQFVNINLRELWLFLVVVEIEVVIEDMKWVK